MRKWWTLLALAVALAAVLPTRAQEVTGNNNLRVRAGVFFPQKSATRDAAGKAWFTFGAEYVFQKLLEPGFQGEITVSADYMGNKDMQNIPVQLNVVGAFDRFAWTVGAGIGFAKNAVGDAKTGMVYSVGVGVQLSNTTAPLELGVMWRGMTNVSNQLDGLQVHLGLRF